MNRFYRSLLLTGIVAAGLAGCGDDVTVTEPPPTPPPTPQIRGVTVTPDNVTVSPGQTIQMTASVTADSGATYTVTWQSSDQTRATVSSSGLVTIPASATTGAVSISATASTAGGSTGAGAATLNVVGTTVTGVTVTPATATINAGTNTTPAQSLQASATVTGTNNPPQTVTWSSLDQTVATVDANGLVTANANGVGGPVNIKACSTVDNTKCGFLALTVVVPSPAVVQIQSVTYNPGGGSVPVVLTNVFGQIEIGLNIDPGSKNISRVDALIGGQVVASQTFASAGPAAAPSAAPTTVILSTNTAQLRKNGGIFVPVIYNGNSAITANLYVTGSTTPIASNAIPVVMNNPDALVRTGAASLTPTSTSPSYTDGVGNTWYTGSLTVAGYDYVAFGMATPASVTLNSTNCGTSNNLVPAGATAASGISLTGTYDCTGFEGTNTAGTTITTAYAAGAVGPDGTPLTAPAALATVGSKFTVSGDDRWNMIMPAVGTSPGPVYVDNLAPVITPDEIGFTAGCSATIPTPGCWVNGGYALVSDFPATDGGSGVASVTVTDYVTTTTVDVCGTTAYDLTALAEDPSPTKYDACATATDNLGNSSTARGFNQFGLDRTAPTLAIGGTNTYTPDSTFANAVPAQVIDYAAQDNNSGLDGATALVITGDHTLNPGPCADPAGALTGSGVTPVNLVTPFAPDNGCAFQGYYRWSAVLTDRAGNTSSAVTSAFALDRTAPNVSVLGPQPLYAANTAANFLLFADDSVDLATAHVGIGYTATGGNTYELGYSVTSGFGTIWDHVLTTVTTPSTGFPVQVPATQVLAGLVEDTTVALNGATDAFTTLSAFATDFLPDTSNVFTINPVPAVYKDAATFPSGTNPWSNPNLGSAAFSGSGACTFTYNTPTNGPTIPARVLVMTQIAAGPPVALDLLMEIVTVGNGLGANDNPKLISDNGIQRQYQYSISPNTCASLGTLKLIAVDANGVGYLVP